jgi:hypothetical protein
VIAQIRARHLKLCNHRCASDPGQVRNNTTEFSVPVADLFLSHLSRTTHWTSRKYNTGILDVGDRSGRNARKPGCESTVHV